MGIFSGISNYTKNMGSGLGQAVSNLGTVLHLPEWGISEALSGGSYTPGMNASAQQSVLPASINMQPNNVADTYQQYSPFNTTPTGGGSGGSGVPTGGTPTGGQPSGPSQEDILNQGYGDYIGQLDQMLGGLTGQSTNLQNIAQEQSAQQQNTLDLQNTQGQQDLTNYQNKSLKDIGSTIGSGFRAGNILLGSMGAGDSTAANQYSLALAKEGSKQRGSVMADVSQRLGNLKQVYNTATNNLKSQLNQKINEISQWFSQQQMSLQGMKADAAKERSQQMLQLATNALQVAQQQASGMQNTLNTWTANNATSIQQATQQMQQNVQNNPIPTAINTTPQQSIASTAPRFFSSGTNDQNKLFQPVNYNYLT
jgi:hypothetical protein